MTQIQEIKISDLPAAVVLAALYNNAVVQGFMTRTPIDGRMTVEQAQSILNNDGSNVRLLFGRNIYVHFGETSFDPTRYDDRNHTPGLAARIVDHVRSVLTPELLAMATTDFWVPVMASRVESK